MVRSKSAVGDLNKSAPIIQWTEELDWRVWWRGCWKVWELVASLPIAHSIIVSIVEAKGVVAKATSKAQSADELLNWERISVHWYNHQWWWWSFCHLVWEVASCWCQTGPWVHHTTSLWSAHSAESAPCLNITRSCYYHWLWSILLLVDKTGNAEKSSTYLAEVSEGEGSLQAWRPSSWRPGSWHPSSF